MTKVNEYLNAIENTLKETRIDIRVAYEKGITKIKTKTGEMEK